MRFMEKYGANVAGFFWNAGTALQFFFGIVAQSPREIASALFNVASPCSFLLFGHTNLGVVSGGVLGFVGTVLAVYPGLVDGEAGTIFGLAVFAVLISLSVSSAPLTRRFAQSPRAFLRHTLGRQRRVSGLGSFFFTRMPIIYENIVHGRWKLAVVFALWALGDFAFSFSRARMS